MLYRLIIQHKTREEKLLEFDCEFNIDINDLVTQQGREFLVKKRRFDIVEKKVVAIDILTTDLTF